MTPFFLVPFLLCVTFTSADITLTPFADVCFGDTTSSRCSVTGTGPGTGLRWQYNDSRTNTFNSGFSFDQFLLLSPFRINTTLTSIRNGVVTSDATVNVSSLDVVSSLAGTVIECESTSTSEYSNFTISFNIKNQVSISYINVEEISATEVIITWDGAECVDYYVIECGVYRNTTTSERLVIKPGNNCFSCVVSGINFFGQNFTFMRTEFFCLREYMFNAQTVVDNSTLYIVIEANVTNQPLITSCFVSLNFTEKNCSETMKVVSFDVVPGSYYEYSVMINNVIGLSTSSGNIDISSCPTVTPTSSPCPTNTPCPTSTPCPPPVKCGPWFILFIIAAVAFAISLIISFLIINCLCLRICIFEKRMCCSKCQDNPVWRQIFCYKGCPATEVATDTDKKKLEDKISSL